MKATIPTVSLARANVSRVDVGQVGIGPISIGELVLQNTLFSINAGRARMFDVSVRLRLDFDLTWNVHIGLPWPFDDIDIGDTVRLGHVIIPLPFGTADVPSLQNINLNIPSLTANGVTTEADPIVDLALTDLAVDSVRVTDVVAPVPDFALTGLGLQSLGVDGVRVPGASAGSATIRRVTGSPLQLGALRLRGLVLPSAAANDITSGPIDLPVTRPPVSLGPLDLGILDVTLKITPSANAHIARLVMSDVRASARIGAIVVRNVRLPYDALNLTLSDLGLETIDIPTIGLS
jgi:hypothetical protein